MRLDYYDLLPAGMEAYMSYHGRHFSKAMYEWAVSMMEDRNGKRVEPVDKKMFDDTMQSYGLKLKRNEGFYDGPYVYCMAKSDYYGSSITDEQHLAMYVRDYIDDIDGNPTRAFDEFIANCAAKGVDIAWEAMM